MRDKLFSCQRDVFLIDYRLLNAVIKNLSIVIPSLSVSNATAPQPVRMIVNNELCIGEKCR